MQRLFGAAPSRQGQFGIINFPQGMADNELASVIDDRHQLGFGPASPIENLRKIRVQNLKVID
jgi:hypothetical protein